VEEVPLIVVLAVTQFTEVVQVALVLLMGDHQYMVAVAELVDQRE
jgi:hypothetical protein